MPRVLVQCLWTGAVAPDPARWNLAVAEHNGMRTAGYVSLSPRRPWPEALDALDRLYRGFYPGQVPQTVFVDVELSGLRPADVLQAARSLAERGFRVGIYTRRSFWVHELGNPRDPEFAAFPLWDALWNGVPEIPEAVDYGPPGWTVVGRQYRGGSMVREWGVVADHNVFDLHFFLE
jgi:hypothetical protein